MSDNTAASLKLLYADLDLEGIDVSKLKLDEVDAGMLGQVEGLGDDMSSKGSTVGVADMTNLTRLDENTVLNNLKVRFNSDAIYTYIGSVLVSINSFKTIDGLYEGHEKYKNKTPLDHAPHIYPLVEKAYSLMRSTNMSQSFIISGESGAGKTEAMKQILKYLTTVWSPKENALESSQVSDASGDISTRIMEANPIMEAFGNAKTVHNRNSSRFGKYTEIQFDDAGHMLGAHISDYLLEKTRIVVQGDDERNYHVFYFLCQGADPDLLNKLGIRNAAAFKCLTFGGSTSVDSINDAEEFKALLGAMNKFFNAEFILNIWEIVAAVMHLGNIEFSGNDEVHAVRDELPLQQASTLLGADSKSLLNLLTTKKVRGITAHYSSSQAYKVRDTLAKTIYSRLFQWIVVKINENLSVQNEATRMGILDIFGFEIFKTNDLEQLCINYANESLQDLFNEYIFRLEQAEYRHEKLSVDAVNYVDNKPALNCISQVFTVLDDQCRIDSATPETLSHYLDESLRKDKCFMRDRKKRFGYVIVHYAGKVTYDGDNFIVKNKESVPPELDDFVDASTNKVLMTLFEETRSLLPSTGKATISRSMLANKFESVTNTFKKSLANLIDTLKTTNPFFIRCLKPNSEQVPNKFETEYILQQMRSTGMLDTIHIRQAGYPVRFLYEDLINRYIVVLPMDHRTLLRESKESKLEIARQIMQYIGLSDSDYALGETKMFIKDRPADLMESRLATVQRTRIRKLKIAIAKQKQATSAASSSNLMELQSTAEHVNIQESEEDRALMEKYKSLHKKKKAAAKMSKNQELLKLSIDESSAKVASEEILKMNRSVNYDNRTLRKKKTVLLKQDNELINEPVAIDLLNENKTDRSPGALHSMSPMMMKKMMIPELSKDVKVMVDISTLFVSHDGETKKTHFTGLRTETEIQRLFRSEFANIVFPTPFPKLYITDPLYRVEYELYNYADIGDGVLLKTHLQRVSTPLKIDDLSAKLDRGFDIVKDYMRVVASTSNSTFPMNNMAAIAGMSNKLNDIKRSSKLIHTYSDQQSNELSKLTSQQSIGILNPMNPDSLAIIAKKQRQTDEFKKKINREVVDLRRDVAIIKQVAREAYGEFQFSMNSVLDQMVRKVNNSFTANMLSRSALKEDKQILANESSSLGLVLSSFSEDLHEMKEDVVRRKIKPPRYEVEALRKRMNDLEDRVNTLGALYDKNRDLYKKVWEVELKNVMAEQDYMDSLEETVEDVESNFDSVAKVFDALDAVIILRETEIIEVDLDAFVPDDVTQDDIMDTTLMQITFIKVDPTARLKSIAKMESLSNKRKLVEKNTDPMVKFTQDLGSQRFHLRKTGGTDAIEEARKKKELQFGLVGAIM